MEVGVFPADPRAIAAAEVLGVSLKLRPLIAMPVPLVICAAKMLIGGVVVGRPAKCPQMMMSSLARENWRGNRGGKNRYHA